MEKDNLKGIARALAKRLREMDYDALPVSDYNKQYIARLRPALSYYMAIYADCIRRGTQAVGLDPKDIILVDYGGGSGFLSILAKEAGIGQVIYIDLNPLSVDTVKLLKEKTGMGPDTILPGDSDALAAWCEASQIKPHLLIATDLIEHIYNLSAFFTDLYKINDQMRMIFTTASTPYNPFVKHRLRKFMKGCEKGSLVSPNYYTRRKEFIKENYPDLSEEQVDVWASCTRGLTYTDMRQAIRGNTLPLPADPYNTCDPETGNWAERILPISCYRLLLNPLGYRITIRKGFYNADRNNRFSSCIAQCLNLFIRLSGKAGLCISPFIILILLPSGLTTKKAMRTSLPT